MNFVFSYSVHKSLVGAADACHAGEYKRLKRRAKRRQRWLKMEFRTFLSEVISIPAQIMRTARRTVIRFLAWRPELSI